MCYLTHHNSACYSIVFCLRCKRQEGFRRRRGKACGEQVIAMVENTFANDPYLVNGFAFAVYDFWYTLTETPVMINTCKPHVFIGEKA
jgi:hypothetical protein